MKRFLTLLITICLLTACKDKNDDSQAETLPVFANFTHTDNMGVTIGTEDATDWKLNDTWNNSEKKLFPNFSSYTFNCSVDSVEIFPAYPNPAKQVYLHFRKKENTRLVLRVVKQNGEVILSADSIYNSVALQLPESVADKHNLVRAYYMLIHNDSCAFIGHGDIKIQD